MSSVSSSPDSMEHYGGRTWNTRSNVASGSIDTSSTNSGAAARHVVPMRVTRSAARSRVDSSADIETPVVPTPTPAIDPARATRRLFTKVYKKWSRSEDLDHEDIKSLETIHVTEEEFLHLTGNCPFSKYISLIDYHICFNELPRSPHGEIIGYMVGYLSQVFQIMTPNHVLFPSSDNGMASSF